MDIIIQILIALLLAAWIAKVVLGILSSRRQERVMQEEEEHEQEQGEKETPSDGDTPPDDAQFASLSNTELLKKCLHEMGCKWEQDKNLDYHYYVKYQGETFIVDVHDDQPFVSIYDTFWYEIPTADLDGFSTARTIINDLNSACIATLLYTIDKEGRTIHLHTCHKALFGNYIPQPYNYLERLLNDMLYMQRQFYITYGKKVKSTGGEDYSDEEGDEEGDEDE